MTLQEGYKILIDLLKALAAGAVAAADRLSEFSVGENPYRRPDPDGAGKPAVEDPESLFLFRNYKRAPKSDLLAALKILNPDFKTDGLDVTALRAEIARIIALRKADQLAKMPVVPAAPKEDPDGWSGFKPPGIETDPEVVAMAVDVQNFLDAKCQAGQKNLVLAHQASCNCDLKCVRTGGCCPNASSCYDKFSAHDEEVPDK